MLMAAIASASASASVAVRGHERKKPPSQFDEPPVVVDGEPVRATVAGVDGAPARGEAPLEELEDRDGRSSLRRRRCDLRAEPAMAAASVDRGFSTTWYVNACSASAEARASVMSAPSRSGCGAPGMRRVPSSHVPFCERSSTTWPPRPRRVGRDAHRKVAVRDALARGGELVAAEHVLVGRERERRQPGPERAGEAQHRDRRTSAGVAQPQLDLPARHHARVGPVLGLELGEAGHDAARAALQHELQASCR